MRVLLDHSIVGQSQTTLTIRKDREFAGCRICGAVFQSVTATDTPDEWYTAMKQRAVAIETRDWRDRHNRMHSEKEHLSFVASNRTLSPEAAHKLAPFGLAPLDVDAEVAHALATAPRAPTDDCFSSLKLYM